MHGKNDMAHIYYGVNPLNNEEVYINRKSMACPNAMYIGTPGSGHFHMMKDEMLQIAKDTDDEVIFLTPFPSYCDVEAYGFKPAGITQSVCNPYDLCGFANNDEDRLQIITQITKMLCRIILDREVGECEDIIISTVCEAAVSKYDKETPTFAEIASDMGEFYDAILKEKLGLSRVLRDKTDIEPSRLVELVNSDPFHEHSLTRLSKLVYAITRAKENCKHRKTTWIFIEHMEDYIYDTHLSAFVKAFIKCIKKYSGIVTFSINDVSERPEYLACIRNTGLFHVYKMPKPDLDLLSQFLPDEARELLPGIDRVAPSLLYDAHKETAFLILHPDLQLL